MEKVAIVYASTHHKNTYKLVKAIADKYDITQIDAAKEENADLSEFDLIGLASGIDFGKFYESIEKFLENNLPENKKVFFLYTCAKDNGKFTQSIKEKALAKKAEIMGEYGCRGYNTYGPLKLIGGMNKKNPTSDEIADAVSFFETLIK